MRILVIVLSSLVGLVAAAVLIGPSLVDWNAYKDQISSVAYDATGRTLSIDGDISLSVLPSPKLLVKNVRLANLDGGQAADMVRLKSLDVRLALVGLLAGKVQVQSVNLVDPVINLEVLADGRRNWELTPPVTQKKSMAGKTIPLAGAAQQDTGSTSGGGPDIRLDNFTLSNGTVLFRDAASGTEEKLTALNANLSARSTEGPFESSGSIVARDIPLTFAISVGQIIEGRTVPLNATVQTDAGETRISVAGVVLDLAGAPRFKGKASFGGNDLAALLASVSSSPGPALAKQAFSVAGEVNATAESGEFRDVTIELGAIKGAANVNATFGDVLGVGAAVHFGHVDLDALLATQKGLPPKAKASGERGAAPATGSTSKSSGAASGAPANFALPAGIAASLALNVDAITVNGGTVSQARVNVEMVNGEITVSQALAQFPGGTDVALFGFVTAEKGIPKFDGDLEATVGDTRSIARWLGTDLGAIPADRLRSVSVSGKVAASPAQASLNNLRVMFDGSTLTGGLIANLGGRPSLGADVTLDKINVDAYMGPSVQQTSAPATGKPSADADDKPASSHAPSAAGAWQAFSALTRFDANVKAHVERATLRGVSVRDTVLDATLHNGSLTLRRASVADAAHAAVNVTGTIKGLGGIPDLEGLSVALTATDPSGLMKLAGSAPPPVLKAVGPIKIAARMDGSVVKPAIKATVDATGGQVGFDGRMSFLPLGAGLKGTVSATHPDARKLLTILGQGYRPAGTLGDLAVTGQLDATPSTVSVSAMQARIGKTTVSGDTKVSLQGARPTVLTTLSGGVIDLTPFLPAEQRAESKSASLLMPAAFAVPGAAAKAATPRLALRAVAASQRWSRDPIDLSGLQSVDADVALTAQALVQKGYRLGNADIRLTLNDGVLNVSRLNGTMFGGTIASSLSADTRAGLKAGQTVSLKGVDLARLTTAATGEALTSGNGDVTLSLSGTGTSVAGLMETLGGTASAALTGMDVRKGAKGSAFAPLMDLFLGLNNLGGALTGGKAGSKADISATFTGANGLFTSNDIKLTSGLGDGSGKAKIDVAGWRIEADGEVNMSRNVLGLLLSAKGNLPNRIPFSLSGPLDKPNVKIDSSLTKGGLPIPVPGIDKLLGKKGGAIGDVLQGILGGGGAAPKTTTTPAPLPPKSNGATAPSPNRDGSLPPPPPPPSAPAPQQPQKIDPAQLLKGLLSR